MYQATVGAAWAGVDPPLLVVLAMAATYNVAVIVLKRFIRRFDRRTQPFILQTRDFAVVQQARARATSEEEKRFCEKLILAMYGTIALLPLFLLVAFIMAVV